MHRVFATARPAVLRKLVLERAKHAATVGRVS